MRHVPFQIGSSESSRKSLNQLLTILARPLFYYPFHLVRILIIRVIIIPPTLPEQSRIIRRINFSEFSTLY